MAGGEPTMWKAVSKSIKARGFDNVYHFNAKSLTPDQLNELLLGARRKEWIGNSDLIDFVVKCGLSENDRREVEEDRILGFNVAREIWLLTLQSIAVHARRLTHLSGLRLSVHVKRYRYIDLVTPGFINSVLGDMSELNVEGFSPAFLATFIPEVVLQGKRLSRREKTRWVKEHFSDLVGEVLTILGIDQGLIAKMPGEVLSTPAQKFYVALRLVATLDWFQYQELVHALNLALKELLYRSNQLGGGEIAREKVQLPTGFPLFPALIGPTEEIPLEVALHLLHDAHEGKLSAFKKREQAIILSCLEASRLKVGQALKEGRLSTAEERADAWWLLFGQELNQHSDLIRKSCFVYMDSYSAYAERHLKEEIERHKKALQYLSIPDCYVLVEGPSDEACFRRFLRLVDTEDLIIKVEACGGKSEVEKRCVELRSKEKHAGAVVPILDEDASQQYENLRRRFSTDRYTVVLKLKSGAIENLFPVELLCEVANQICPGGEQLRPSDLVSGNGLVKSMEKALFQKKRTKLDKCVFAKALAKRVKDKESIPAEAQDLVSEIVEVAKLRREELPRPATHLAAANSRKIFEEAMTDKLRNMGLDDDEIAEIIEEAQLAP
jgi:hypothetical protein